MTSTRLTTLLSLGALSLMGCGPSPDARDARLEWDAGVDAVERADSGAGDVQDAPDVAVFDAAVDAHSTRDSGPDCGPHGSFHINHCDCDPGYREVALICEPIPSCPADDALEPNDLLAQARPWESTWSEASRRICAGDTDLYLVEAAVGERIVVELGYAFVDGDLDAAIYEPGRDPRFDRPIARGTSATDMERVAHRARRAGVFAIEVTGASSTDQTAYRLQITVEPAL